MLKEFKEFAVKGNVVDMAVFTGSGLLSGRLMDQAGVKGGTRGYNALYVYALPPTVR